MIHSDAMPSSGGRAAYLCSCTGTRPRRTTPIFRPSPKTGSTCHRIARMRWSARSSHFRTERSAPTDSNAPGIEVGRPKDTYRRVRIDSTFGKIAVLVTDGQLPYPYGRQVTGYEVANLADTLTKAKITGATALWTPTRAAGARLQSVPFPWGATSPISTPRSARKPHLRRTRKIISRQTASVLDRPDEPREPFLYWALNLKLRHSTCYTTNRVDRRSVGQCNLSRPSLHFFPWPAQAEGEQQRVHNTGLPVDNVQPLARGLVGAC